MLGISFYDKLANKNLYWVGKMRLQLLELQAGDQKARKVRVGVEKPLPD